MISRSSLLAYLSAIAAIIVGALAAAAWLGR
jgi:hypothetical protein